MRLHSAKVPQIAAEMVGALLSGGDVESESPKEVGLDIASVLNQYIRDEQEVSEQAKDMLAARGLPQTEYNRIRKLVAEERKIKLGEDAIDYLLDQLVEMLMHSGQRGRDLRRRLRAPPQDARPAPPPVRRRRRDRAADPRPAEARPRRQRGVGSRIPTHDRGNQASQRVVRPRAKHDGVRRRRRAAR